MVKVKNIRISKIEIRFTPTNERELNYTVCVSYLEDKNIWKWIYTGPILKFCISGHLPETITPYLVSLLVVVDFPFTGFTTHFLLTV